MLVKRIILETLKQRLSSLDAIDYTLRQVKEEIGKLRAHSPNTLQLQETELHAEERRLVNFVDFIGEGRGSRTFAQALIETERKVDGPRISAVVPKWQAVFHAASRRKVDLVLVWKLDRAFRSVLHASQTLEQLRQWGVGLRSYPEPWADTTSPRANLSSTS